MLADQIAEVSIEGQRILGIVLRVTTYTQVIDCIVRWAASFESRYVCFANVHMIMEAYHDTGYFQTVNAADLTVPDGVPLVWALRAVGSAAATRVYGPDTTRLLLQRASDLQLPVGFYGSKPETLTALLDRVHQVYPDLKIAYSWAPPFRPLSPAEDDGAVQAINAAGVCILFVGLGCPKQEEWMAQHRSRVNAVMLGVGAAFDFLSETKRQAPRWMMRAGLEWVFRFVTEPRRLWVRYLKNNPKFVLLFARQVLNQALKTR